MVYANIDFTRKSQFIRAIRNGEPVVLWDSAANQPAVNGVVVVESWSNFNNKERWVAGKRLPDNVGWHCRVRLQDTRVKEILH
jgi:predicted RNA-binding protein with PUA-like domain